MPSSKSKIDAIESRNKNPSNNDIGGKTTTNNNSDRKSNGGDITSKSEIQSNSNPFHNCKLKLSINSLSKKIEHNLKLCENQEQQISKYETSRPPPTEDKTPSALSEHKQRVDSNVKNNNNSESVSVDKIQTTTTTTTTVCVDKNRRKSEPLVLASECMSENKQQFKSTTLSTE